jgi:acyl dehydratase
MLYALGVGVGALDPCDPQELKYVYEKNLVALPTFAVTLAAGAMRLADPAYGINYRMLLHAEQTLEMHKPLPVEGTVVSEAKIDEIYDKGASKGAIMYMTRKLYEASSGDLLVTMGNVAFLRADGGFGGKSEGAPKPRPVPADRPPDLQTNLPVTLNQALIYRLAGDYNPLHIDPEVARSAGFERPILHGLGAYGTVGRALIKVLCGDDPGRLRRLDVRFTSPSIPASRCTRTSGTSEPARQPSDWSRPSATSSSKTSAASSTKPSAGHHVHGLRRHHDHDGLRPSRAVRRDGEGPRARTLRRRANHRRDARGAGVLASRGRVLARARVLILPERLRARRRRRSRCRHGARYHRRSRGWHAFLAPTTVCWRRSSHAATRRRSSASTLRKQLHASSCRCRARHFTVAISSPRSQRSSRPVGWRRRLGPKTTDIVPSWVDEPTVTPDQVSGVIITIDHFGNLITTSTGS